MMKFTSLSFPELNGMVLDIVRQMNADNFKPDYIVGITRGGLIPAVMLSHFLDVPMHSLGVSFRDGGGDQESNLWMSEDAYGHKEPPKNILIVDDINDTGRTLEWIKEDWESSCFPGNERWENVWNQNVKFATLYDNESSSFGDVDYFAKSINKAEIPEWIEFPYENWWRG